LSLEVAMALAWKKVLCPIDFSENARAAMRVAVDVCRQHDADLVLFHSYELPGYTLPEGSVVTSPKMLQDLADRAEEHLLEWQRAAQDLGAPRVAIAKGIGEPAAEIVELGRDGAFDLIVVGTHGRTGIRHALLGSIAERVVRRAGCPVLTVHPEGWRRAR
jgi:nucleotide-binding universal stress UspA family protein